MDDLIRRQEAIDAILHNQEVYSNNFGDDPIVDKYTIAIIDHDAQTIAQLPSAQPEIVRCKDCKYVAVVRGHYLCIHWSWYVRNNDFCSHGEGWEE